jgi:hypothetical protein
MERVGLPLVCTFFDVATARNMNCWGKQQDHSDQFRGSVHADLRLHFVGDTIE